MGARTMRMAAHRPQRSPDNEKPLSAGFFLGYSSSAEGGGRQSPQSDGLPANHARIGVLDGIRYGIGLQKCFRL